jgi:hypothetical protein
MINFLINKYNKLKICYDIIVNREIKFNSVKKEKKSDKKK